MTEGLTFDELNALPAESVVRDNRGVVWVKIRDEHHWSNWHGTNGARTSAGVLAERNGPIDVLWAPAS